MTWTYTAGSSSAATILAGRCEFPSLVLGDGSFRSLELPPRIESAPLRFPVTPLPGDGEYVTTPKLAAWPFTIQGWFYATDPFDTQAAIDYLLSNVNVGNGWQTVYFDAPGWTDQRQMTLIVAGQVAVTEPEKQEKKVPQRVFAIPVIAADPRRYSKTAVVTPVTTGGVAVANNGNYDTPIVAVFTGPLTSNPSISDGTHALGLNTTLTTGQVITVNTYDPTTGGLTAVDQTGANAVSLLNSSTLRTLAKGSHTLTRTGTGTGTIQTTTRHAYA